MVCAVLTCPATATRGYTTCGPHRSGQTAQQLGIMIGVEHCVRCRRAFKADDFVSTVAVATTRHRKPIQGKQHVACGPKRAAPSRKAIRVSKKPLFDRLDE